jgi:hypothetical protein
MAKRPSIIAELKSQGIEFTHGPDNCIGFHGTSRGRAADILKDGFDLSMANPKAWFGQAFYFYDNAAFAATKSAISWAVYGYHHFSDPASVEADLRFSLLLDLTTPNNGRNFWDLRGLLQRLTGDSDLEEQDVCRFIGTKIAAELGSDGIAYNFTMQKPPASRSRSDQKGRGFAVKKLKVIVSVR